MLRWLQRKRHSLPPPHLTDAELREWRTFVEECNEELAASPTVALRHYANRIQHAVIRQRLPLHRFLEHHPAPWRAGRDGRGRRPA